MLATHGKKDHHLIDLNSLCTQRACLHTVASTAANAWVKLTMYYYRYQDVTIVFQWVLLLQLHIK